MTFMSCSPSSISATLAITEGSRHQSAPGMLNSQSSTTVSSSSTRAG